MRGAVGRHQCLAVRYGSFLVAVSCGDVRSIESYEAEFSEIAARALHEAFLRGVGEEPNAGCGWKASVPGSAVRCITGGCLTE